MMNLAVLYEAEGRIADALQLTEEAYAIMQESLRPDHPSTLICSIQIGGLLEHSGRFVESQRLLEESLEKSRSVFGDSHLATLECMVSLATT